jgi:hypothetical protein
MPDYFSTIPMKSLVIVLLFAAGFCLPERSFAQKQPNCPEIKVTTSVTNTTDDRHNGKIEFKFEDGSKGDQFKFFITPLGAQTTEGTKDGFKNLKTGHYDIYVIDRKNCLKQVQVQVK